MESPIFIAQPKSKNSSVSWRAYLLFFIAVVVIEASATYLIYAYKHANDLATSRANSTTAMPGTPNVDDTSAKISFLHFFTAPFLPANTPTTQPSPTVIPMPTATPSVIPTPSDLAVSGPPANGYSHITIKTDRGNFAIDVASIKMLPRIAMIVDSANDTDCSNNCPVKSLGEYVQSHGGFAGINGTYFCPPDYAECAPKLNSFDFPIYNTRIDNWINGKNIYWNDRALVYKDFDGMHFYRRAKDAWRLVYTNVDVEASVVNAPGLLDNGVVIVDQYPLTDKQQAKGVKAGIGFNATITYLVIAQNVDMVDFAYVFKAMGATYALNLDSGGSAALWFGNYVVGPGRKLPNAIIFKIE